MEGENRYRAQGFVILVCADAKFFELAKVFEENLLTIQGSLPVIGDLGLTEAQKAALQSQVIDLKAREDFRVDSAAGFIKATHKPAAIRRVIKTFDLPCIALDADMLLTQPLQARAFARTDIALTPRIARRGRSIDYHANGYLNSGFLYAANTPGADRFLARWEALCETEDKSDQEILSDMAAPLQHEALNKGVACDGLTVMKLSPHIYNDTTRRHGKIMHFKSLGRGGKRRQNWERLAQRLQKAPRFWGMYFAVKRRFAVLYGAIKA